MQLEAIQDIAARVVESAVKEAQEKPIGVAYETTDEIIICGEPPEDPEGLSEAEWAQYYETAHNCDCMGCGFEHVLYRFKKEVQL